MSSLSLLYVPLSLSLSIPVAFPQCRVANRTGFLVNVIALYFSISLFTVQKFIGLTGQMVPECAFPRQFPLGDSNRCWKLCLCGLHALGEIAEREARCGRYSWRASIVRATTDYLFAAGFLPMTWKRHMHGVITRAGSAARSRKNAQPFVRTSYCSCALYLMWYESKQPQRPNALQKFAVKRSDCCWMNKRDRHTSVSFAAKQQSDLHSHFVQA